LEWRDEPAGIVFHTTETDLAPMARSNNNRIRYQGRQLLLYVQREALYNFMIDRFGRVCRVVPENEYAFHAGHSLWADGAQTYIHLNHSFIGVAFETAVLEDGGPPGESVTAAQLASGRLLVEMLRHKFGIVEANAVTHEMVSINPANMLIGYHTDWRGGFPFAGLGLPDNYEQLLPTVADWGFEYDEHFVREMGGRVWPGLRRSLERFRKEAALREIPPERYRGYRQRRYREIMQRVHDGDGPRTWSHHYALGGYRRGEKP
jgi:hypothetical protein